MADAHKNFAYSLVATAPSPATSGTSLVVTAADGAKFPAVPFNATIWPASSQPTAANAEIVRVTARSTDTLTITRAQESTSARTVVVGDQIAATVTAKTLTDIEYVGAKVLMTSTQSITNVTVTPIIWATASWDTNSFWAGGSPTKFTIPTGMGGKYNIIGHATFSDGTSFDQQLLIGVNGTFQAYARSRSNSALAALLNTDDLALSAGDYVELMIYQNSGGSKTLTTDADFSIRRIG